MAEFNPAEFGDRLRDARRSRGLSQRDVYTRVGVGFVFMSMLENGRASPSLGLAFRLAALLGVRVGWLLAGEGRAPS